MDRDPLDDAPLYRAWADAQARFRAGELVPSRLPAHKQRTDLVGDLVAGDLPFYGGLAPIRGADALLRAAEQRTAERWGADWCRYSVGGSTHGNQALTLAVGAPGDTVVVDRTCHRSLLLGLVLAGLRPVWVHPPIDAATGFPLGVTADTVADALDRHPDARAVFVTSPSYVGTCADVGALSRVTRAAGVPLLVDAAWGAHLGSHPELPLHPFAAGADAVVTSAHKTLPALNQGALVLARTALLATDRLDRAMEATATTSPSGAIFASVDAVQALLAVRGEAAGGRAAPPGTPRTSRAAQVPGVVVPDAATFGGTFDDAKLAVLLAGTGADGIAVDRDLADQGFTVEMADRDLLVPMVTIADDDAGARRLRGRRWWPRSSAIGRATGRSRSTPRGRSGPSRC